jgi:phage terminase large subunit-like protein
VGAVTEGPAQDWRAYVLEDASINRASPDTWARAAIAAMDRHKADRLVAEVNQGGEMVTAMIRSIDALVPIKTVHATLSKGTRAEPVSALYEQNRVFHLPGLAALEDQMCQMTAQSYLGKGSPDRVDALVWALTELMLDPARKLRSDPQVRTLG